MKKLLLLSALLIFLPSLLSAQDSLVVPNEYATIPGTNLFVSPTANSDRTYQMLIHSSQLTSLVGKYIKGITYRLPTSASANWPLAGADVTFPNYDIYLSPSVDPALRSLTFADNIAGPRKLARSGPLTIPAESFTFGNTPNNFGYNIAVDTPYLYTGGHLLIELRLTASNGTSRSNDGIGTSVTGYGTLFSALWATSYTPTTGTQGNFAVIKLTAENPNPGTFQSTVDVMDGWNMVSIPGSHPMNNNVDTWWAYRNTMASVYKWTGTYSSVTTAAPTEGYWMLHTGARTYNSGDEWPAGGILIVPHNAIPITTGWNMISVYETPLAVAELTTTPPGLIVPGTIYGWNGSYSSSTHLVPCYGYWLLSTGNGVINIGSKNNGTLAKQDNTENWGKINMSDASGKTFTLYSVKGEANLESYSLPPVPPAGAFDVRYSSQRKAENLNEAKIIELRGVQYPVTLTADKTALRIQDETGKLLNKRIKAGESITIENNLINKLVVSENIVPDVYSLSQNYPNPFNPSTLIQFTLPEDVKNVSLIVYDALGQKVSELVNSSKEAGYYQYQWNASNAASGLYIYQLRTEKFVSTKKMMLIR